MNEADIQKMVDKVDVDNDGSIDFKEFKKMMEWKLLTCLSHLFLGHTSSN